MNRSSDVLPLRVVIKRGSSDESRDPQDGIALSLVSFEGEDQWKMGRVGMCLEMALGGKVGQ